MPWSKFEAHNLNDNQKENISSVQEFTPPAFNLDFKNANASYLNQKNAGSKFVMNEATKIVSGIDAIEKSRENEIILQKVNLQIDQVKKQAFDESFKIGFDEGFKSATEDRLKEINQAIDDFKNLIGTIEKIKSDLVLQNESNIIQMIFRIAEKVVYEHIEKKPDMILSVIKKTIEASQEEEDVTIIINPTQMDFIENLKKMSSREFDFLKNIKLESSPSIQLGGCVLETNYGVIDAQIEKRVESIWNEIQQIMPKVTQIEG